MILVSKIFTLGKYHILDKLLLRPEGGDCNQIDYFTFGNPVMAPPRIRGSIILQLNKKFLSDNRNHFVYGSPVDIGSVKFGFFKPTGDADSFIRNATCDYEKFIKLVEEFEYLPADAVCRILNHEKAYDSRPVLERFFDISVVDFMFSNDDPHARLFEFAINSSYSIHEKHVEAILYPNTYSGTPIFRELNHTLRGKLREYNPKYGIEERWN